MIWILLTLQGGTSGRSLPHMATGGKRYLLRPVLRRRSISAPALCPQSCDNLAAPSKISKAGALFTSQISRWACHWLTLTIRAEWERIWIDDQGVAIARDRFLDGMFESSFSAPALQPRLSHTARAWPYIRLSPLPRVRLQFKAQGSLGARPGSFGVPAAAD